MRAAPAGVHSNCSASVGSALHAGLVTCSPCTAAAASTNLGRASRGCAQTRTASANSTARIACLALVHAPACTHASAAVEPPRRSWQRKYHISS